jgi:cell division protein FtsZ
MLNIRVPQEEIELRPRITVIGVGGGGSNAVNNMIRTELQGVEFLVCNTDAQSLKMNLSDRKIQLGTQVTRGLGAGARPEVGRAAAEEALDEIMGYLEGSNMVFITAGMGGGTGTGGAAVIARAAKEAGILTVGVVTKPFHFEGAHRMRLAEAGIEELQQHVDTLLIIPNQNLFRVANEKTTFADAFKMADEVLHAGVRGVTDLIVMPGLINLDFADIRAVMSEMGKAMMGTGEATGERRAVEAAEAAINNPLLEDASMQGAKGLLINITGGMDMTLFEVDEACNRIRDEVDPDANIIFGSTFSPELEGKIRVSVVATGIDGGLRQRAPNASGLMAPVSAFGHEAPAAQKAPAFMGQGNFGRGVTLRSGQGTQQTTTAAPQQYNPPQQRTGTTAQGGLNTAARAQAAMGNTAPVYGYGRATSAARKIEEEFVSPMSIQMLEEETAESFASLVQEVQEPPQAAYTPPQAQTQQQQQRGERDGDSFIPPLPMMTEAKPLTSASNAQGNVATNAPRASQPQQAQPQMQQQPAPQQQFSPAVAQPEKRTSLFDRLTGGGQPRGATTAAPTPQSNAPVAAQKATEAQPSLAVDNSDRIAPSQSFDDDLDIPAFLRRQAS